jgi:SAM-dependent methyltransferase
MAEDPVVSSNPDFVEKFLTTVRRTIPLSIEQIDMMLQLITAARGERVTNFLDLGCGDGVLSAAILDEHPHSRGVLVEFSTPMLEAVRQQLHAHSSRVEFLEADFHEPSWTRRVAPHAPFDAVVSAFAIHHLPDPRKRELYREVFDLLAPEGIFINIEHVSSAIRWTESIWDDRMIDAIFGTELKASPGKPRLEVARDYYARASQDPNILAPLEVQCDWLREIGFADVECYLKVQELAVFGGQRPG